MTQDAHAQPAGRSQELLYDPNIPTPSHGEQARTLLASQSVGTLSTLTQETPQYPYGSFVTFSVDGHRPTLFISELAEHTRNLRKDARASLMVAENVSQDPLANARVTLLGRMEEVTDPTDRARAKESYLESHPSTSHYIDYSDFAFWQLEVESLRFIGGYGRMSWVDAAEWEKSEPDPMRPFAARIVEHMNEDHGDAMVEYCRAFTRATDARTATMTQVDRYGFEMFVETAEGARPIRLAFSEPIATSDQARKQMVMLVREARAILSSRND